MATVKKTLDIARAYIGTKENPKNSNNVLFNTWFYGKTVSGQEYPWCMAFCQYICAMAGIKLPIRTASCGDLMRASKKENMWVVRDFKPGDICIFDWSGKQKTTNHCGIVEEVVPDMGVVTIEGNTSTSDNSNGGEVMRRTRANKYIVGAVRPIYDAEIKKEDVLGMTIQEFIDKLTDEQAYNLLIKAQRHASILPEPTWSQAEGQWEKAKEKGVINGNNPEGIIKRDEVIAIMGRIGLLD